MTRSIRIAVIGAAFALAASAVHAQVSAGPGEELTQAVSVAGLDPARDGAVLKRRLHTAAVELCLRATEELAMGEQQAAFSRCVVSATDRALQDAFVAIARGPATPARSFALR